MVSEFSLDLFWQGNGDGWTLSNQDFDWFAPILGELVTRDFLQLRFTFWTSFAQSAFQNELDQGLRQGLPMYLVWNYNPNHSNVCAITHHV